MRLTFLFFCAATVGCASAFTTDESTDGTTGEVDGGLRMRDAAPRPTDAFVGRPDRPPIGGDSTLRDALACDLSEAGAERAILVHVACVEDGSTVSGLIEAWHAGLLGTFQQGVDGWTGFPLSQGCDYWRCMSEARSCGDQMACFGETRTPAACDRGRRSCDGNSIIECATEGSAWVRRFNCDVVGGECVDGTCTLPDGCALGGFGEELRCEGPDVIGCSDIRIDCAAVEPGTVCTSFAIGGELPTYYCGPESAGGFVSGAYPFPVECEFPGGSIAFTNQATQEDVRIDCVAQGFNDCTERGCRF